MDGERRRIMTGINKNNKCRRIRGLLSEAINRHFNPDARWLQKHIANCPRCQRRFVSYGKINLAISAIKSQPHKLDLLKCANAQTVGVLKHSLRRAKKTEKLKTIRPVPKFLEKYSRYTSSGLNVAACMTILLLMKIGAFSSLNIFQNQGQKVIKKYYANRIGDDLADEIFPTHTKQPPSVNT
jgi:hypothetical protein